MLYIRSIDVKWFNDHPEYLANPFYVGGDSYAGKIVPFLAQIISEGTYCMIIAIYDRQPWSRIIVHTFTSIDTSLCGKR